MQTLHIQVVIQKRRNGIDVLLILEQRISKDLQEIS